MMEKSRYIIGRAGDITLYDDTVSRRHASLDIDDGAMVLKDLDSRNGTYEIRDKKLVPFRGGVVTADQVFAFGECVRSIRQLLNAAGEVDLADTAGGPGDADSATPEDPLDATKIGFAVAPRKRLSRDDIVGMLDEIEDRVEAGEAVEAVCDSLGVTTRRYQRWCDEHGATRAEREKTLDDAQAENTRLRKLVSDLMLEREALRDALKRHGISLDTSSDERLATPPNFSIVNGGD